MMAGQILETMDCTHRQEQEMNGRSTQSGAKADPDQGSENQVRRDMDPHHGRLRPHTGEHLTRPGVLSAPH